MKTRDSGQRHVLAVLILILVILAAGILTAGYRYDLNYEMQQRTEVERQLSAIGALKVNELMQWRRERLGDAGVLYKNISFFRLVRRFFENPQDSEAQGEIRMWMGNLRSSCEHYDQVCLLNAQGATRLSDPNGPLPVSSALSYGISQALRSRQVTMVDFYRDGRDQRVYLSVLVPILDGQGGGRAIGVLALRINPKTYLYPFINRWPTPSQTAETLLVRRDGDDALFLNDLRFRANTALNLRISLKNADVPAVKAALGRTGVEEGTDYRGAKVLADVCAVPDSPWFLVARMDISEVFAPLRKRRREVIVFVGVLLLGAGAGVGLAWREQHARFFRAEYEAAEALRESEAKYRNIVETTNEGILLTDGSFRTTFVNRQMAEMVGYTVEEMLDTPGPVFLFPEDDAFHESEKSLRRQGKDSQYERRFRHRDGSPLWMLVSAKAFMDLQGRFSGSLIMITDITERKRAEVERERLLKELERKNREMESTIYVASHDLRSPLLNIQGFSRMQEKAFAELDSLLSGEGLPGETRGAALAILRERVPKAQRFIVASAAKMDALIAGLLRVSRLGRAHLRLKTLDMNRMLEAITTTMAFQIQEAHASVEIETLPPCRGDATQINQVFTNLLDNALKYLDPGRPLKIRVTGHLDGELSCYCVADTGVGIAPEHQEKVYELFHRLDPGGAVPGEGLGLTLVRRILDRHDGDIRLESSPGEGSRFFVDLPAGFDPSSGGEEA